VNQSFEHVQLRLVLRVHLLCACIIIVKSHPTRTPSDYDAKRCHEIESTSKTLHPRRSFSRREDLTLSSEASAVLPRYHYHQSFKAISKFLATQKHFLRIVLRICDSPEILGADYNTIITRVYPTPSVIGARTHGHDQPR
jgi:hypothetical protein